MQRSHGVPTFILVVLSSTAAYQFQYVLGQNADVLVGVWHAQCMHNVAAQQFVIKSKCGIHLKATSVPTCLQDSDCVHGLAPLAFTYHNDCNQMRRITNISGKHVCKKNI